MSGIFSGVAAAVPAPAGERIITNAGFWPDIDLNHLVANLRLGDTVAAPRLETAAINAMQSVNQELQLYRQKQQAAGFAAASLVPDEQIEGEPLVIHNYRRAVYCSVGAELAERYRGSDTTSTGNGHADALTPSIDEYRRDARWAISDILGISRSTIELI